MTRFFLIVIVAFLIMPGAAAGAVAPNEVILFEHINFVGNHHKFKLEPWMRHKLVENLSGFLNDRISSIAVGKDVRVFAFAESNFGGKKQFYFHDLSELGNFNDRISSLIIFPKKLAHPQGVDLIIPKKSTWASAAKLVRFYPLPEGASASAAKYPVIGDWNNKVVAIRLYGPVEVVLFEHTHFQGKSMQFPGMFGAQDYYLLKDYQFNKMTSSLIVKTQLAAQTTSKPFTPPIQPVKPLKPTEKPIQPLKPIQSPNIHGQWSSNIFLVYQIKQNGNTFTWLTKGGKEVGHGKIYGSNLSATWQGPGGGSGQATGKVTKMQGNKATRIEWSNGVVFKR